MAQSTIATAGGDGQTSEGSVSYTVGEVVYTASANKSGYIVQGVQQSFDIQPIASLGTNADLVECSVFPNPTLDKIMLQTGDLKLVKFQIFNLEGDLLETKDSDQSQTEIPFSNYPSGAYFLKISSNSELVKTFKIIKN